MRAQKADIWRGNCPWTLLLDKRGLLNIERKLMNFPSSQDNYIITLQLNTKPVDCSGERQKNPHPDVECNAVQIGISIAQRDEREENLLMQNLSHYMRIIINKAIITRGHFPKYFKKKMHELGGRGTPDEIYFASEKIRTVRVQLCRQVLILVSICVAQTWGYKNRS